MNRVVKILMERDGMTEREAKETIADCKADMEICIAQGDYSGAEDMMAMYLGLEPDYVFDIL